jgi:DNA-binding NarL/FixJ family response regulator
MDATCLKPNAHPIRVAMVEDDPEFQGAIATAIELTSDMALVAVAGTLKEGLALLKTPSPDVLLVDLGLPDGSGIDVIRAAANLWPTCGVMVSTTFGDESHVMQSLEAGAAGYLLKDSAHAKLVDEIRSLAQGGSPISPKIARQVLTRFRQSTVAAGPVSAQQPGGEPASLSAREIEVLNFITRGFTVDETAGLMHVSRHTVVTFVRRIYSKLKVTSRAEAIYEARNLGLLET